MATLRNEREARVRAPGVGGKTGAYKVCWSERGNKGRETERRHWCPAKVTDGVRSAILRRIIRVRNIVRVVVVPLLLCWVLSVLSEVSGRLSRRTRGGVIDNLLLLRPLDVALLGKRCAIHPNVRRRGSAPLRIIMESRRLRVLGCVVGFVLVRGRTGRERWVVY